MPLSNLNAIINTTATWLAQDNLSGQVYSPIANNTTNPKMLAFSTIGNTMPNGSDELYSAITQVNPNGTATLNLTSFTDILGNQNVSFVRVKFVQVQNLSTTDDLTYGTNCTGVSIGGGVQPFVSGTFNNIYNGGVYINGAPTSGGIVVTSGAKNILITNLDSVNSGSVQITVIGGSS